MAAEDNVNQGLKAMTQVGEEDLIPDHDSSSGAPRVTDTLALDIPTHLYDPAFVVLLIDFDKHSR